MKRPGNSFDIAKFSAKQKSMVKLPINLIFLFSILITCIISFISFLQFSKSSSSNALVAHTYQVMQVTSDLLYEVTNIELQEKNYLLTKDNSFSSQIQSGILKANQLLKILNKLTNKNLSQHARVILLTKEINDNFDSVNRLINLKIGSHSLQSDQVTAIKDSGAKINKLNSMLNEIEKNEYNLLNIRTTSASHQASSVNSFIAAGQIVSILFLLASYFLFNRELVKRSRAEEKLKSTEDQLRTMIDSASDMIAAIDLDYRYIVFNQAYKQEFRDFFEQDIDIGTNIDEVASYIPQVKDTLLDNFGKLFAGKEYKRNIEFNFSRHEKNQTYEITFSPIKNESGTIAGAVHIIRNITEHISEKNMLNKTNEDLNKSIEELKDKNEKITLLLEMSDVMLACNSLKELSEIIAKYCGKILNHTSGLFYIMHPSKNYLDATATWGTPISKNSDFVPDECWALRLGHIHSTGTSDKELICEHARVDVKDQLSYLCVPLRAQSETYGLLYVEISSINGVPRLITGNERMWINAFAEISALSLANIRLRDNLRYHSMRDSLTSLYNRRYLEEFLLKLIHQSDRANMPIAVMMLDIDYFKRINDVYGHDVGDIVLKELSQLFSNEIRQGDLAARYGGEEFIIVLYNTSEDIAKIRAEEIKKAVSQLQFRYGAEKTSSITISIGISVFPNDGKTASELIAVADKALYFAKNSGRNKVVMSSEIAASLSYNNAAALTDEVND